MRFFKSWKIKFSMIGRKWRKMLREILKIRKKRKGEGGKRRWKIRMMK